MLCLLCRAKISLKEIYWHICIPLGNRLACYFFSFAFAFCLESDESMSGGESQGGEESWGWWSNPASFDLGVSPCHLCGTVSYPLSLFSHLIHGSVVTAWTWFCLVWWSQKAALCSSCTVGQLVIRQSSTRQQTITQHIHIRQSSTWQQTITQHTYIRQTSTWQQTITQLTYIRQSSTWQQTITQLTYIRQSSTWQQTITQHT